MLQNVLSGFAVYFIIWWITLFAVLPVGLKTQHEEGDIIPGSAESAPHRFRAGLVFSLTTLISALVYGAWIICSTYLGFGLDALPHIGPRF